MGNDGNERESQLQIIKRLSNPGSVEGEAWNQCASAISPTALGELGAGTKKNMRQVRQECKVDEEVEKSLSGQPTTG